MKALQIIGILAATVAYVFISVSISLAPWFDFRNNALSDLGGSAYHGSLTWIFNTGLMLSGALVVVFSVGAIVVHRSWKYSVWLIPLALVGINLALVGFFSEDFGEIHRTLSITLFMATPITLFIYSYVSWPLGSPKLGALALAFGVASALIWFVRWPWQGVAIQETITMIMASIWLILVALKNV